MINFEEVARYTKKLNILYVEDEDMLREDNCEIFENFFKKVDVAVDGKDGLEQYRNFYKNNGYYYDIVFTDINMPNLDGNQLISEIHKINLEQVISVISAYNETDRFIKLIEQGIASFILKPIKSDNLMQVLYKLSKDVINNKLAIENIKGIKELNFQLKSYNETLNNQVQEQVKVIREKDKLLYTQSKLAAMGEMMDAIAHQWKQPLSVISMYVTVLKLKYDVNELSVEFIEETEKAVMQQIKHLIETTDEFRSFFRANITKQEANIVKEIKNVFMLMNDTIVKNSITTQINIDKNLMVNIVPSEFKHIIINLINNSKDAFIKNSTKNRNIVFNIEQEGADYLLEVKDNAGGIPPKIINNIFAANFTTKAKNKGTGIGLYMSKMIIEKIGGKISVENYDDGACFSILIPQ